MENSIYSVISPEGCASILWKDPSKSQIAAKALKLSANDLLRHKIIDEIIPEPTGGAHRNKEEATNFLKVVLRKNLEELKKLSKNEIISQRKDRFLSIGRETKFSTLTAVTQDSLALKDDMIRKFQSLKRKDLFLPVAFALAVLFLLSVVFFG